MNFEEAETQFTVQGKVRTCLPSRQAGLGLGIDEEMGEGYSVEELPRDALDSVRVAPSWDDQYSCNERLVQTSHTRTSRVHRSLHRW